MLLDSKNPGLRFYEATTMMKEQNKFVAARAMLKKTEEDLGDPISLDRFRNAINVLLAIMSGVSPRIEKDIAKKLVLTYRNKVLSQVKVIVANHDSHEAEYLEHWNKLMGVFVDPSLAEDAEFNACKEHLLRCGNQPIVSLKAAHSDFADKPEPQATWEPNDGYLRILKEIRTMLYSKSLRAIGQSLEMLRLPAFRLQKRGDFYIVLSGSLTETHEWILKNYLAEIILDSAVPDQTSTELTVGDGWLCYGPLDISRLNAREGKKRDNHVDQQNKVAHLLGILGEHLDSKKATGFEISWAPDSVTVEYQMANGARERKDFTVEKLEQLALYSKFKGRAVATQSAATQGSG
jgi:hypothetical protein